MISRKLIKFLVYEILEFAAFFIPTLVVAEQFASAYRETKNSSEKTSYWLIVSVSIAYVALVALIVWVPVKVLLYKKHHLCSKIKQWRPSLMICMIFTTLPSFGFSIAVAEVKMNVSSTACETLPDFSVSLVLGSLIIVDIIEKLRKYPLRGRLIKNEVSHTHTTNLQQVRTVTESSEENRPAPQPANDTPVPKPRTFTQKHQPVPTVADESPFSSGILRTMSRQDKRAEIFLNSFIMWSDTIEMLRVSGHHSVFKSRWLYPVYIFSYISLLRIIVVPHKSLVSSLGVFLQDFPFMFVRISLIAALGTITPVLGLIKNVLVTFSYFYFNYFTIWRFFTTNETSFF
ncbi:transmembrane protein 236 [Sarcophilus harrisii]|uniref:transmembrane protein 236 n=1 Tax=Sarcophilus harrisii TaxID=9305 RepID=UPI001301C8C3|nr:transmembrane protein 236 [Sarcophilus harrisii]